jgi:hypothetical protein
LVSSEISGAVLWAAPAALRREAEFFKKSKKMKNNG